MLLRVSDPEPEPLQRYLAPDLPHFGKRFTCHGPSGVLTFRIDIQDRTHDGLVIVGGTIVHGAETYPTGVMEDRTGHQICIVITESEYMRLSNAPPN